jgi:hypothetical protein
MPTPTYVSLGTITLGSTDSEVIFSSIPATYRDLIVVATITSNVITDIDFRFNGNTSSVYSVVIMSGDGSSTFSPTQSETYLRPTYYGQAGTTAGNNVIMQIMDYSATDKHKTVLARTNNASIGVDAAAGRFAVTDAITSISIFSNSGRIWQVGSVFSLYGILA